MAMQMTVGTTVCRGAHITHGQGNNSRAAPKGPFLHPLLLLLCQDLCIQVLEAGLQGLSNAVPTVWPLQALTAVRRL